MQEEIKSEGVCLFCGKTFAKAGINRHLITHLDEKQNASGVSFLLKVEQNPRWEKAPYFLSLWVDGDATLKQLDKFLRDIWLECCGHLSAFRYKATGNPTMNFNSLLKKLSQPQRVSTGEFGEIPFNKKAKDVFYKDLKLDYEYDFGSSTELEISVVSVFPYKADKSVVLLSRNEPLKIMCSICGKVPATQLCSVCMYDKDAEFCDKCAKIHAKECEDFADYASMPLVNSPRMGVCCYEGGIIDVKRDNAFKT
jgi:hypothetical protein